jgi:hypothetical protein
LLSFPERRVPVKRAEAEVVLSEHERAEIAKALEAGKDKVEKRIKHVVEITRRAEEESKKGNRVLFGNVPL